MRSALASLCVTALLAAAAPAAAATTAAPAAPAAPAQPAADAAPPAPTPDPFLAEVLTTCRAGASGDPGTRARLAAAGWDLSVDGDTQTPYYQSFSGEKDFDGVGTVDITFSTEVYPSLTEGYCSLSIETALRRIGIADLAAMPDLEGTVRQTADGIASTWQDKSPAPTTFIQVDQHARDLYFILDVTTLMHKPAAELPFVQPDNPDNGTDMNGTDAGAALTNAHS